MVEAHISVEEKQEQEYKVFILIFLLFFACIGGWA